MFSSEAEPTERYDLVGAASTGPYTYPDYSPKVQMVQSMLLEMLQAASNLNL